MAEDVHGFWSQPGISSCAAAQSWFPELRLVLDHWSNRTGGEIELESNDASSPPETSMMIRAAHSCVSPTVPEAPHLRGNRPHLYGPRAGALKPAVSVGPRISFVARWFSVRCRCGVGRILIAPWFFASGMGPRWEILAYGYCRTCGVDRDNLRT